VQQFCGAGLVFLMQDLFKRVKNQRLARTVISSNVDLPLVCQQHGVIAGIPFVIRQHWLLLKVAANHNFKPHWPIIRSSLLKAVSVQNYRQGI
jgi:hypothetical protein